MAGLTPSLAARRHAQVQRLCFTPQELPPAIPTPIRKHRGKQGMHGKLHHILAGIVGLDADWMPHNAASKAEEINLAMPPKRQLDLGCALSHLSFVREDGTVNVPAPDADPSLCGQNKVSDELDVWTPMPPIALPCKRLKL
ncbi:MAG: hypothetical protein NVS4B10_16810 [Myxococcales bacterium]